MADVVVTPQVPDTDDVDNKSVLQEADDMGKGDDAPKEA